MKVIKRLISNDYKIFKIILDSKITVEDFMIPNIDLFLNNPNIKDYENFSEQIKFIYDLNPDYIKNIKGIKQSISFKIGEITVNYALKNNIMNNDIKKIILSNINLIGKYSEQSDLLLEDAVPVILETQLVSFQRDFNYINGLISFLDAYYSYLKNNYQNDYKEKFSVFKEHIYMLFALNRIGPFYKFLSYIKDDLFSEKEFNELINKQALNRGDLIYFISDHLNVYLKNKGFNEEEIKDQVKDYLFNGHYKFIINRMIKEKASHGLKILSIQLKERLPEKLEDIISLSVEALCDYIPQQNLKDQNEIIEKYLYRFTEAPSVTFAELKKRSYFFNIINGSVKRAIITYSPRYAYAYYADVLNSDWENETYEKKKFLINLLENKISSDPEYSLAYFKSRIYYEKKNTKKLNIKKFIEDGNYKIIVEGILNSVNPKILYEYAKTTKIKLPQKQEGIIKSNSNIYNDYLKINFKE